MHLLSQTILERGNDIPHLLKRVYLKKNSCENCSRTTSRNLSPTPLERSNVKNVNEYLQQNWHKFWRNDVWHQNDHKVNANGTRRVLCSSSKSLDSVVLFTVGWQLCTLISAAIASSVLMFVTLLILDDASVRNLEFVWSWPSLNVFRSWLKT